MNYEFINYEFLPVSCRFSLRHCTASSFHRLYMNTYMSAFTELPLQSILNGRCRTVCFFQCYFSVHTHVHLYRVIATYAAGTQMMRRTHSGKRKDNLLYLILHIGRQRFLQQFIYTRNQQLYSYFHNEEADNHRSYRVEHPPVISQRIAPPIPMAVPIEERASLR